MFMILEDQYGVGDTVNLGDAIGIVESVGLRVTQVRDTAGVLWYVPNGQIARVGNSSQGWSRAIVDVSIGYGQDTTLASEVLAQVGAQAREDPVFGPLIIEDPEVWGVEQLSANAVVMRMVVKTLPTEQARVGRELRHRAQLALTRAGISPPFMQGRDDPSALESPSTTKP
jgi:small conductance mechanosensitive channel